MICTTSKKLFKYYSFLIEQVCFFLGLILLSLFDLLLTLMQPSHLLLLDQPNLEELNLVRGFERSFVLKLRPHVTAYGAAKINVNTASLEVLQTVAAEMDRDAAEEIIQARQGKPFSAVAQLKDLPGMEAIYGFIYLYLEVKSSRYQVESTAFVNDGRRTIRASIAKDGDRILYKRVL